MLQSIGKESLSIDDDDSLFEYKSDQDSIYDFDLNKSISSSQISKKVNEKFMNNYEEQKVPNQEN
jgi:hypothetical protein